MGLVYRARDTKLNRDVALKSCRIYLLAIPTDWPGSLAKHRRSLP
jgi:hypothetical protein